MGLIKICGITNLDDALLAAELGADILGFIFAPGPRRVTIDKAAGIVEALPKDVRIAFVYLDEVPETVAAHLKECRADFLQLHGKEDPKDFKDFGKLLIKTLHVGREDAGIRQGVTGADFVLLDTYVPDLPGGTGRTFDWESVWEMELEVPWFVSGGLKAENVGECIRYLEPFGVDASSGVEKEPGKKDPDKIHRFIAAARAVFGEIDG